MMEKILVSIVCDVYNHESFLTRCLEGFVSQKTKFNFEVLIHDDASTDRSASIIKKYTLKYPSLFKPYYQKENQYSKGIDCWTIQFPRVKGKYIAICEGDDFWTDPYKLQKQVDVLESKESVGLVYTRAFINREGGKVFGKKLKRKDDLFLKNPIPTLTVMFRANKLTNYMKSDLSHGRKLLGDYPLWLWISLHSDIAYIDDVTAVHLVLLESASQYVDKRKRIDFNFLSMRVALQFLTLKSDKRAMKKVMNKRFKHLLLSSIRHLNIRHLAKYKAYINLLDLSFLNRLIYKVITRL